MITRYFVKKVLERKLVRGPRFLSLSSGFCVLQKFKNDWHIAITEKSKLFKASGLLYIKNYNEKLTFLIINYNKYNCKNTALQICFAIIISIP